MFTGLMRLFLRVCMVVTIMTVVSGVWHIASAGKIYAKAWLAESLLDNAWQKTKAGEQQVRPWPWADTWPVAELIVPRLGVREIILSGDSGRVLAFSPGFNEASALPGTHGKTLFSGHRDTHFTFLKDIKNGDVVEVLTANDRFEYVVSEQQVVDQRNFVLEAAIEAHDEYELNHNSLILVTCFPFDALQPGGNGRYVVVAEEIRPKQTKT
mgnify:CR=1 FL=1